MSQLSDLMCPRCGWQLYSGHTHDHVVHGCLDCGGVWLDAATSARVIQTACHATVQLAKQAAQHSRSEVDTGGQHSLSCPICRHTMRTTRVQQAWLDIDTCDAHGVWYDRGELERVARTARIAVTDWRSVQPPPAAGGQAAMAAGAVGAGVAGAAGVGYAASTFGSGLTGAMGTEVAAEIGAEIAIEGLFAIIAAFFD